MLVVFIIKKSTKNTSAVPPPKHAGPQSSFGLASAIFLENLCVFETFVFLKTFVFFGTPTFGVPSPSPLFRVVSGEILEERFLAGLHDAAPSKREPVATALADAYRDLPRAPTPPLSPNRDSISSF